MRWRTGKKPSGQANGRRNMAAGWAQIMGGPMCKRIETLFYRSGELLKDYEKGNDMNRKVIRLNLGRISTSFFVN